MATVDRFVEVDRIMIQVAKFQSEFGKIEILQAKHTGSLIYRQGGYYQSECDSNGVSVAPYIHGIFGLLAQARAEDVLMIGCGGGSLGTMLDRAGARVTIVDIDPTAFFIARKYFGLPRKIECHVADGSNFLHAVRHRYDAIVLDAYTGGDIPHHLCSESFFGLAQMRLDNSCGCLIGNVCARNDRDTIPRRIAAKLSNVWADVRLLDTPGIWNRNALLLAGQVKELAPPMMLMPPEVGSNDIVRELDRLRFTPWQLPEHEPYRPPHQRGRRSVRA
ncbi:MAG: fused MFS/spermidine synthase [Phyllobacterium sp.]|uniref:spermidine synthase n=1 Tax=Phyllobacterium sp. TaxID=1871046 RepID=UPI0030F12799